MRKLILGLALLFALSAVAPVVSHAQETSPMVDLTDSGDSGSGN
jgi:hypothetical protein